MSEKEEYAVILDFLPNGLPMDTRPSHRKSAIAQAMGKSRFTLLELVPKKEVFLNPNEEVYIGEGKREGRWKIIWKKVLRSLFSSCY